jgi:hypothetical protein
MHDDDAHRRVAVVEVAERPSSSVSSIESMNAHGGYNRPRAGPGISGTVGPEVRFEIREELDGAARMAVWNGIRGIVIATPDATTS